MFVCAEIGNEINISNASVTVVVLNTFENVTFMLRDSITGIFFCCEIFLRNAEQGMGLVFGAGVRALACSPRHGQAKAWTPTYAATTAVQQAAPNFLLNFSTRSSAAVC